MGVTSRCLKLLLLVTMVPLALRAALLLLSASHAAPAAPSHRRFPIGSRRSGGDASAAAARASVSAAGSAHGRRPYTQTRHRRRIDGALAAIDGARRLRHADAGGWFEDDKRLAPTDSNPLHNLR